MALHDPARLSPISRQALREAYRAEENACVAERMAQASGASAKHEEAAEIATRLIEEARVAYNHCLERHDAAGGKSGLDDLRSTTLMRSLCLAIVDQHRDQPLRDDEKASRS